MKRNNKTNKDIIKNAKAKTVKRPVKKEIDPKAVIKDISARGKKMFLTNRKTVSGFKKFTKGLAKLITEANQTGDQKLVSRITKLFGYLGFNTDSAANKVSWCFDAKVKPMKAPKAKLEKKSDEEKKPTEKVKRERKPRAKKDKAAEIEQVPAQPAVESETPAISAEPTPEELEKLEGEPSPEVLAGDSTDLANVEESGSVDDESDDEDEQEPNEEDEDPECDGDDSEDEQESQSYEDGLAEYRREAWGNGDFERDDI